MIRGLAISFVALAIGVLGQTGAFAGIDQEGYRSSSLSVDGTTAILTPHSFHPWAGHCALYSVLILDWTQPRQMETGLVKCSGSTLDGVCTSDHSFTERFDGSSYFCAQGATFQLDQAQSAIVQRTAGTTSMWATTAGSYMSQSGFASGHQLQAFAWAEATGGSWCPTDSPVGHFAEWKKFSVASGWSYVSVGLLVSDSVGIFDAPCWSISTLSTSGDFDAS
ncbi:MAG: hypothetical protein RL441_1080 [Actinomycetota bacterium]